MTPDKANRLADLYCDISSKHLTWSFERVARVTAKTAPRFGISYRRALNWLQRNGFDR